MVVMPMHTRVHGCGMEHGACKVADKEGMDGTSYSLIFDIEDDDGNALGRVADAMRSLPRFEASLPVYPGVVFVTMSDERARQRQPLPTGVPMSVEQ